MEIEKVKLITATEAAEKTKNSNGRKIEILKKINQKIEIQCEKGETKAWVDIPDYNSTMEQEIKDELRLAGYVVKGRQSSNVLIEW